MKKKYCIYNIVEYRRLENLIPILTMIEYSKIAKFSKNKLIPTFTKFFNKENLNIYLILHNFKHKKNFLYKKFFNI